MIFHQVYFWLKSDLTTEQEALFLAELKLIKTIPYLATASIGKPSIHVEKRGVVDLTFSYSLNVVFTKKEEHDFYQNDCPQHKRFIETCKTFWSKVIVYDSDFID
jgi:Stress responsive A/B Barrel Domain